MLNKIVYGPDGDFHSLQYFDATYSKLIHHSAEKQGWDILFSPPDPLALLGKLL